MKDTTREASKTLKTLSVVLFAGAALAFGILFYQGQKDLKMVRENATEHATYFKNEQAKMLGDIEYNLQNVSEGRELSGTTEDYAFSTNTNKSVDRIWGEMRGIQLTLEENEYLANELRSQLATSQEEIADYRKRIRTYDKKLETAYDEIDQLIAENIVLANDLALAEKENKMFRNEIEAQEAEIEWYTAMFTENEKITMQQQSMIDKMRTKLSNAYYVVGSSKDLKDANVIEDAGLFGIGDKKISPEIEKEEFVRINKFEQTSIPIFSKKAELVTPHNSNSYEWETNDQGITYLKITDPGKFWETSKYLIITTKKPFEFKEEVKLTQ
ncbi:MAG: hypothetical protein HUJ25_07685 [Crocinitomicaceae bacterium]|nr:hypothetical protein [Crocinitomicaceae bacterium]